MSSVIKKSGWADLPAEQLRDVIKRLAKQPCPKDRTIQCFIKRDKSNMTYRLYVSRSPGSSLVENGKFLFAAKRTRIIPYKEYVISMDANNISRSSTTYIGKLRSNFLGTKFEIDDTESEPNRRSLTRWFNKSKKVSPKQVPSRRNYNNIAQVKYELNVKTHGPCKIHCINHSIPKETGSQEEEPLVLKNKPPRWHEKLKFWRLNFKGRVSVKNFQLLEAETALELEKLGESDGEKKIIIQFGKVDKDVFTMDYGYPLSAFQAFAICLTIFDAKLVCE